MKAKFGKSDHGHSNLTPPPLCPAMGARADNGEPERAGMAPKGPIPASYMKNDTGGLVV